MRLKSWHLFKAVIYSFWINMLFCNHSVSNSSFSWLLRLNSHTKSAKLTTKSWVPSTFSYLTVKDFRLKISRFIRLFTVLLVQVLSLKFCWKFLFFFNSVYLNSSFTTSFLSEMTQSDLEPEIFNNLKTLLFL